MGQKSGSDKQRKLISNKNVSNKRNVNKNAQRGYSNISGIKCFYTNADQLRNKMNELNVRVQEDLPQIIGIAEPKPKHSRLQVNLAEFSLDVGNYDIFSKNIDEERGRGLLLYVDKALKAKEVKLRACFEENLFIRIELTDSDSLVVCLFYRSPTSVAPIEQLRDTLCEITNMNFSHVLVMGDFNFPNINWDNMTTNTQNINADDYKFVEYVQDNYWYQHVKEATRWRENEEPHILDLVFTNEADMIENISYLSPLGKSDHVVITFLFKCYTVLEQKTKMIKCYNRTDYVKMNRSVAATPWTEILERSNDINEKWMNFKETLMEIENKYVPVRKVVIGKSGKYRYPLDRETLKKIKEKHALGKKAKRSRSPDSQERYKKCRNQVRRITRKLRKKFEHDLALRSKTHPKAVWQYIKSKSKTKVEVGDLYMQPGDPNTPKIEDNKAKANVLAKYFSDVFTVERGEVPTLENRLITYELEPLNIDESMVRTLLKGLKTNKAPGPDQISPWILKELADSIAMPLTLLFSYSLRCGVVPDEWKRASVSPIFKKGDKSEAGNYRPVSLTSVVCKILETVVRDHLVNHMKRNLLFSNQQYGFLKGKSTTMQLLNVLDVWTEALDSGSAIDCVYLDFQKAFDKVPHKRLLGKLHSNGINNGTIKWIESFLTGRQQSVRVAGCNSDWHSVTSGVPQGSVLGPILFVIYVNDLPERIRTNIFMFADDTKIFNTIKTQADNQDLQDDLNILEEWCLKWQLRLHPEKCKLLHVGRENVPPWSYQLGDTGVSCVDLEKDIGVTIDNKLKFEEHLMEKVNKANAMMGVIRRTFQFLDSRSFVVLYKAMVRSFFDYASPVWQPYSKGLIEKMESVQRRATKLVPGMKDLTYPQRLRKIGIPTLRYRMLRADMIEIYKMLHGYYDESACSIISLRRDTTQQMDTRGHSLKLFQKQATLNRRKEFFGLRAVKLWNSLSEEVVCSSSLNIFKNKLDKYWDRLELKYDNFKADPSSATQA